MSTLKERSRKTRSRYVRALPCVSRELKRHPSILLTQSLASAEESFLYVLESKRLFDMSSSYVFSAFKNSRAQIFVCREDYKIVRGLQKSQESSLIRSEVCLDSFRNGKFSLKETRKVDDSGTTFRWDIGGVGLPVTANKKLIRFPIHQNASKDDFGVNILLELGDGSIIHRCVLDRLGGSWTEIQY